MKPAAVSPLRFARICAALLLAAAPLAVRAQSVASPHSLPAPPQGTSALDSPPTGPSRIGSEGQTLIGMPKFHEPAPYDIDEHTGFTQIFDEKSLAGWMRIPPSGEWKMA